MADREIAVNHDNDCCYRAGWRATDEANARASHTPTRTIRQTAILIIDVFGSRFSSRPMFTVRCRRRWVSIENDFRASQSAQLVLYTLKSMSKLTRVALSIVFEWHSYYFSGTEKCQLRK